MFMALCVAAMARAEPAPIDPNDMAGRWVAQRRQLVLDLSRCGAGWCGVEVVDDKCGRTALRLDAEKVDGAYLDATGRLELAAGTRAYAVRASLFRMENGTLAISIAGNTGDTFEPWRRQFPFSAVLARKGDVACRPDNKTS